jgi:hypothetical protein
MPEALVIALFFTVIPASLVRLWWIWWHSGCHGCGQLHKTCSCPATDHVMRPRR